MLPILVRPPGSCRVINAEQHWNAPEPIALTVDGIATNSSDEQPENAIFSILVTPSQRLIATNFVIELNAPLPITSIDGSTSISVTPHGISCRGCPVNLK